MEGESTGQIRVTSTTDSQEAVQAAADGSIYREPKVEQKHPSNVEEVLQAARQLDSGPRIESTTDKPADVAKEQAELNEIRDERRDEFLGKTRRKLVRQIGQLAQRNDELRQRLSRYETQRESTPQNGEARLPQQPQNSQAPPEQQPWQQPPQLQNVETHEQTMQRFQEAQRRLPELAKAAQERYGDYQETLERLDRENPVSPTVAIHTSMLENGPDVAYFLAKHPGHIAKLWAMEVGGNGVGVIGELNALSWHLAHGGGSQPSRQPRRSSVPEPIRPVSSGSSTSNQNPSEMDYRSFKRWREGQGGRR
jgi:hypothetical protein